jgi:hypothetical protein
LLFILYFRTRQKKSTYQNQSVFSGYIWVPSAGTPGGLHMAQPTWS